MTVYVRLGIGVEDSFPPYSGCENCGSLLDTYSRGYSSETHCPKCDVWGMRSSLWNPTVNQDSTGGLILLQGKSQIAYYPAGVWLSWRSD